MLITRIILLAAAAALIATGLAQLLIHVSVTVGMVA